MMDILIALLLTYIPLVTIKKILNYLYMNNKSDFVYYLWDLWRTIKYGIFGGYINIVIGLVIFFTTYLLITYRKTKSLVDIINETEIMANGDLDRVIQVNAKGDINTLAKNINSISKQLKDITISERNSQKTKNDLITNVSHDLRTPLTSIMGYLELVDTDQYKDEVTLRYYVSIAYEKCKGLNLLINDLFELTKMQNNTINLDKTHINVVDLLGQVVAYFEYQFKNANMEARISFSKDRLLINGDGGKLVRAIENLLSNAIKYGKDGHYVDITTKFEESMAVVQVINYGESIPSIDLPYIFDRFYRVEKSRSSDIGGSGLGLAITKNIIELHGGTIWAFSGENRTVFEVRLPVISQ